MFFFVFFFAIPIDMQTDLQEILFSVDPLLHKDLFPLDGLAMWKIAFYV